jgi:hypothetical protein
MSLITTLDHAYATAISDMRKVGSFVKNSVLPVLQKANADASTIEAITALVSPAAANIERVADAALGVIIKAIEDAGSAAGAGGVSVSLDAALVADIKAIIPTVKAAATTQVAAAVGTPAPVTPTS